MDLQAWGVVAQIVGAVGVVGSLLYLAVQIRQARKIARAENAREVQAGFVRIFSMLAQDAELARIYRVGCREPGKLDPIERQRFDHLTALYFIHFVECHTAHRSGLMDTDLYEPWRLGVAAHLQTAGGSDYWNSIRDHLKPDAVQAIEDLRGKVAVPTELRDIPGEQGAPAG